MSRPHLPHQAKGYPAGVQVALVPFGERALRHFLFLERPEGMELTDAEGFQPSGPALPIMSERDLVPWGQEFATVGHLYRSIEGGLARLAEKNPRTAVVTEACKLSCGEGRTPRPIVP